MNDTPTDRGAPPKRPENVPEREWRPGDSLVLPPIDPVAYAENAPSETGRILDEIIKDSEALGLYGRPEKLDPVRRATRQRIQAWMDGRKGCV